MFKHKRQKKKAPHASPKTADYWRKLNVGSFVVLRDFQALEEYSSSDGINYEIIGKQVYSFFSGNNEIFAEYLMFDLADTKKNYKLVTIITGSFIEFRIYFQPDGFEPGSRTTLLSQGFEWLFIEPTDSNSFIPAELDYAQYPNVPPINDGYETRTLSFSMSSQGPLWGEYHNPSNGKKLPVNLIEYISEESAPNPLMIMLEEGGIDLNGNRIAEGGYITLFLGCTIDLSQMDIYPI